MESKWRLNRWASGIDATGPALYARALHPGELYITTIQGRGFATAIAIEVIEPPLGALDYGQFYTNYYFPTKPNGPASPFPYGFAVVPDHP